MGISACVLALALLFSGAVLCMPDTGKMNFFPPTGGGWPLGANAGYPYNEYGRWGGWANQYANVPETPATPAQEQGIYFGHTTVIVSVNTLPTESDLTTIAATFAKKLELPSTYVTAENVPPEAFTATCGEITSGGGAFASCTGTRVYDSTKASATDPNDANCCKDVAETVEGCTSTLVASPNTVTTGDTSQCTLTSKVVGSCADVDSNDATCTYVAAGTGTTEGCTSTLVASPNTVTPADTSKCTLTSARDGSCAAVDSTVATCAYVALVDTDGCWNNPCDATKSTCVDATAAAVTAGGAAYTCACKTGYSGTPGTDGLGCAAGACVATTNTGDAGSDGNFYCVVANGGVIGGTTGACTCNTDNCNTGYSGTGCGTGDSCDASAAPTNGGVGTCTSSLESGSTCQPTCDTGYTPSGTTSCLAGVLTPATCSQ